MVDRGRGVEATVAPPTSTIANPAMYRAERTTARSPGKSRNAPTATPGKVIGQTRTTQVGIQKSVIAMPAELAGDPGPVQGHDHEPAHPTGAGVYPKARRRKSPALKKALDPSIGATFVDDPDDLGAMAQLPAGSPIRFSSRR
ncbi:MAG: hypothetical protein HC788_07020 [Sphingopyxis sp.]|nr:hypothetical protein [Sphingopyxis sp.]